MDEGTLSKYLRQVQCNARTATKFKQWDGTLSKAEAIALCGGLITQQQLKLKRLRSVKKVVKKTPPYIPGCISKIGKHKTHATTQAETTITVWTKASASVTQQVESEDAIRQIKVHGRRWIDRVKISGRLRTRSSTLLHWKKSMQLGETYPEGCRFSAQKLMSAAVARVHDANAANAHL